MKSYLNASEVAQLLKVDRATVTRWAQQGNLRGAMRLGKSHQWRIPLSAFDDHSGARHVHLIACTKARIETQDLKALRESATQTALTQRQERDLAREAELKAVEEAQWVA